MCLFSGHYLVDYDILAVRVKKYGVTIRHMHPVAFPGGIQTLNIPMYLRKMGKTIEVFRYYPTILLMKAGKKIINSLIDPQIHQISLPESEFLLCPVPRNSCLGGINGIKIRNKLQSLMFTDQLRDRFVKCLTRVTQIRESCPCAWGQGNPLVRYLPFLDIFNHSARHHTCQ